jgi:tripartite-type tricarboxylate transporter receptor subunit TctC
MIRARFAEARESSTEDERSIVNSPAAASLPGFYGIRRVPLCDMVEQAVNARRAFVRRARIKNEETIIVPAAYIVVLVLAAAPAAAQDYPGRAVRVIDPFSPGGGSDVLARIAAQKLTERLGQTFVVENRPGGGGHIGAEVVVKSPPNGYTLLVAGVVHAIGMTLYRKLPYDLVRDLAPISQLATFPSLIVVHPSLPAKSVKELLALAKARPGELNYGANPGSPNHLAMELFNSMGKVKMIHIGYKGGTGRDRSRGRPASSRVAGRSVDLAASASRESAGNRRDQQDPLCDVA